MTTLMWVFIWFGAAVLFVMVVSAVWANGYEQGLDDAKKAGYDQWLVDDMERRREP